MRFFRRSLIALGVAATLPTLLLAAVGIFYSLRTARAQIESATLARSATVIHLSDAALRGDLRALEVLTSSVYFDSRNWAEFYPRLKRVLGGNAQWLDLYIVDALTGDQVLNVSEDFAPPHASPLPGTASLDTLRNRTEPTIGGIVLGPEPTVHLYVPVQRQGATLFFLIAAVRAQVFQDILVSQIPDNTVGAIVDRNGNFIARSANYALRVGTPGTQYLRAAIRGSTRGLYRGTTYEGLQSYTAFETSHWSGWSAHIAVPSALIDRPTSWSFVVAGTAGLSGLLLAVILVVLVLRDMAERRRAEEALRQSQKMEAVGQLTGGIAHDFNNLLTAIIGNLDLIRTRSAGNERLQRLADNALEAAKRGAKVTSQLLAFSRSQRMQLAPVDLDTLLTGMSSLLSQSVGPAITVNVSIAHDARFVISDANQLELALLNLAVNARDAMPAGGTLSISTHPATDLDVRELQRRPYIEIRVSDTGEGMTETVRTRAIEPFFTTKPVGHGTGLGLSQVYGVTRESGGKLFIDTEVGRGTTIRIVLPMARGVAVDMNETQAAGSHTPTIPTTSEPGEKSVLVVDDDRQVRRFVTESLRNLGYHVVAAANGTEALEQLHQQSFDLLVADFAMAGMNGAEVARAAQELRPDLKVLMVSGYADSAAIEAALGATPLLRKPFDTRELATVVAQVLDAQLIVNN